MVGVFVGMGVAYIFAEFVAMAVVASTVGLAVGSIMVIGFLLSGLKFVWDNPLRTAKAWCYFLIGASSYLCFPFLIMFALAGGKEHVTLGLAGDFVSLCCAAMYLSSFFVIPAIYRWCLELREPEPMRIATEPQFPPEYGPRLDDIAGDVAVVRETDLVEPAAEASSDLLSNGEILKRSLGFGLACGGIIYVGLGAFVRRYSKKQQNTAAGSTTS